MIDDEGCFACGALRLEPFGTYTIQAAHEKELGRMREALRAAEKRELEALAELDEERDNVRTLKTHVETLQETNQLASKEVMRLREERDALVANETSIEQNVGALLDLYHDRMIESEHQEKLAWERAAEKDRAYGEALAERDEARAEAIRMHERFNLSKPASTLTTDKIEE